MRWPIVQLLLRRMRKRCSNFETLIASTVAPATSSPIIPLDLNRRWQTLGKMNEQNGYDCQRALAAIDEEARIPTDGECVRQQLLEAVAIRVRELSAAHAWGSTSVVERLFEPELENNTVNISVETDDLPHSLDAVWMQNDLSIAIEFHLSHVNRSPGGRTLAVYRAALKGPGGREA